MALSSSEEDDRARAPLLRLDAPHMLFTNYFHLVPSRAQNLYSVEHTVTLRFTRPAANDVNEVRIIFADHLWPFVILRVIDIYHISNNPLTQGICLRALQRLHPCSFLFPLPRRKQAPCGSINFIQRSGNFLIDRRP